MAPPLNLAGFTWAYSSHTCLCLSLRLCVVLQPLLCRPYTAFLCLLVMRKPHTNVIGINSTGSKKPRKKHFHMHEVRKFCLLINRTRKHTHKKFTFENESIDLFPVSKGRKGDIVKLVQADPKPKYRPSWFTSNKALHFFCTSPLPYRHYHSFCLSLLQNPKGVMDICNTVITQFLFPYKKEY